MSASYKDFFPWKDIFLWENANLMAVYIFSSAADIFVWTRREYYSSSV